MPLLPVHVRLATEQVPTDAQLESLLYRVYVGEGFTSKENAATSLTAEAVRCRGDLLVAVTGPDSIVAGTAILVGPSSPARRLAMSESEAELHLLAVLPEFRRHGVGRKLVASVLALAKNQGFERVLLWTQPRMDQAQRLYKSLGFERFVEQDFCNQGREFWVMRAELE